MIYTTQKRKEIPCLSSKQTRDFFIKFFRTGKNDCWKWLGSKDYDGYGKFNINGISYLVHRIMFQLTYNENIVNFEILHKCDNPSCVNPEHMFKGDQITNMLDRDKKGRCIKGVTVHTHKLTEEQVKEIRFKSHFMSAIELAKTYNINRSAVYNILKRETWRHIK